jgi:hypothetical protein
MGLVLAVGGPLHQSLLGEPVLPEEQQMRTYLVRRCMIRMGSSVRLAYQPTPMEIETGSYKLELMEVRLGSLSLRGWYYRWHELEGDRAVGAALGALLGDLFSSALESAITRHPQRTTTKG